MQIAMIGAGYVGLVTGACFADLGYDVTCVESDARKLAMLERGESPIYEPGLDEMLERNIRAGRLHFSGDMAAGAGSADIVFLAVGTPGSPEDGLPDLTQLKTAASRVARVVKDGALVVIKSTVPSGTTRWLAEELARFRPDSEIEAASNPEFLRQGTAIKDFMQPDRVVAGVASSRAKAVLTRLYAPICDTGAPLLFTTYESSELIKYASNTLLAAKIAFINEMADVCEKVGANVREVARGVGLDKRLGPQFLQPGPGFGGSCFPKDTLALLGAARQVKVATPLIQAVVESNESHKRHMLDKILAACGGDVAGKTLAVLGLTFKAGTDDMRESVSMLIVPALLDRGAKIRVYDPQGMQVARQLFSESMIAWCEDAYDALNSADAGVILTEWNEFKTLSLPRVKELLRQPILIDCRNLYKRRDMIAAGLRYISVGRAEASLERGDVRDMVPAD